MSKKRTQLRLMGPSDQVRIREQAVRLPNSYSSSIFPCNKCNFTCTRVNVIISHIKSHQYDVPTKKKFPLKLHSKPKNKNSKKRTKRRRKPRQASKSSRKFLPLPEDTSHLESSSKDRNKTPDVEGFKETTETPEIPIPEAVAEIVPVSMEEKMETIRVILSEFGVNENIESPADLFKFCKKALYASNFYLFLSLIYPGSPVINLCDSNNMTLFHVACGVDGVNHNILDSLLTYGENINAQTANGSTPLHVALFRELFKARLLKMNERNNPKYLCNTRFLIKKGANIDIPDMYNRTPLDNAIFLGYVETVNIFLNEEIPGEVENRCLYTVKCILEQKPQYNLSPDLSLNLLNFSIRNKNSESFQYILSKIKIDLNVYGSKILCYAACCGEFQCLKILIDKGVNPNVQKSFVLFSLFMAVRISSIEIVQSLLDCGTPSYCRVHTFTPLHLAVLRQATEIVKILLKKGVDVNALTNHQGSHMIYSTSLGVDQQVLDFFFRRNIIIGTNDGEGQTALSYACKLGNLEIVKVLLSHGATIETRNTSTLHYALIGKNPDIVKIFLNQELSLNCRSPYYGTPLEFVILHMGKSYNERKIVTLFAAHFAKILAINNYISIENLKIIMFNRGALKIKLICEICLEELKLMKQKNISPKFNFSFLDILSKDIDYLGGALDQEDIRLVLNAGKYKEEFYMYSKELENRIKKAECRRILIKLGNSYFQNYLNKKIPFEIVLIIFKNLSFRDLINFISGMYTGERPWPPSEFQEGLFNIDTFFL